MLIKISVSIVLIRAIEEFNLDIAVAAVRSRD